MLARPVSIFRASDVIARHAALVAEALEAAEVTYFVISAEVLARRVLVVSETERSAALQALHDTFATTGTHIAAMDGTKVLRPHLVEQFAGGEPSAVRVFQYQATDRGQYLGGEELGCEIQFWRVADETTPLNCSGEPITPGSLLGDRSVTMVPDILHPDELELTPRLVDGVPRPTLAQFGHDHLLRVTQPIDVVYTWVDGADPAWLARKSAALFGRAPVDLHASACNDSRYSSRDELKYSLRSLDMYADWVRHVYLVTDDQVPAWLDTANPRLTVISHREIFGDRGRLPTFNSHAIETQLHRIPGLAEHFLYLNDDVFFARICPPSRFVHANGLTKFFLSSVRLPPGGTRAADLPVTTAAKNNRDLLIRAFGRTVTHKFKHVPHALRRSVLYELETTFADDVKRTAASQFRCPEDISVAASLAHYYGYVTARAVQSKLSYSYVDIGHPDAAERLDLLRQRRVHDILCLNDHDSSQVDAADQLRLVHEFLDDYFPLPSPFELAPTDLAQAARSPSFDAVPV